MNSIDTYYDRLNAIYAAKKRHDIGFLVAALTDGDHRFAAAKALGELGAREAIPELMRLLRANDSSVRWKAAQVLGRLEARDALENLLELVHQDPVPAVRSWAMVAVAEIDSSVAGDQILQYLDSDDHVLRRGAALAMGVARQPAALTPLRRAAAREPWHRRSVYRKAIRRIQSAA